MTIIPRILVVDDTEEGRYAVARSLRNAGYEVVEVGTGREALELAKTGPEVIVLDVRLPDINGLEVSRRLRSNPATRNIPILQTSATFTRTTDKIQGLDAGADAYLASPIDLDEMLAHVRMLLRLGQAQKSVIRSEERQNLALQLGGACAFEWDWVKNEVWCSSHFGPLFGKPRADEFHEQGESYLSRIHPEDRPRYEAMVQSLSTEQAAYTTSYRAGKSDGSIITIEETGRAVFDPSGKLLKLEGIFQDITRRQQTEENLRRTTEELQTIMDLVPVAIWVGHDANNTHVTGNRLARELSKPEAAANPRVGLVSGERPRQLRVFRQGRQLASEELPMQAAVAANAEIKEDELEVLRLDGTLLSLWGSASPLRDSKGNVRGSVAAYMDITELKKANRALRDSEERARELFESLRITYDFAPIGIAEFNVDGRLRNANRALCELTGYSQEELLQLTCGDLHWPADRPALPLSDAAAPNDPSASCERRFLRKDGSSVWVEERVTYVRNSKGEPLLGIIIAQDNTPRRKAEEALREREERFRAMADGTPLMIWMHDAQGRQQFVNRSFCEFFGLSSDQIVSEAWLQFVHADDAPAYMAEFMAATRERRPFHAETRVRRADGQWRWLESFGQPRFSSSGEYLGLVGTSPDITERKAFLEELERVVAERTRSLKETTDQLNTFCYSIAHDLKAPIRAQSAFASLLQHEYAEQLGQGGMAYAKRIADAADRQSKLVTDLLAHMSLARADLPLEPVNLLDAFDSARADLQVDIREKRAVIDSSGINGRVLANPASLHLMLSNLLSNAVKFVPEGKQPRVKVWSEVRPGLADQTADNGRADTAPGLVRLWVEDNGIGIPSRFQSKLFGIFQRLHALEKYPGTGMGLAIVKRAAERMGGRVGVESEQGQGSKFWIELPVARENGLHVSPDVG